MVSNIFYFHPYLGKIPNLTNIFQTGLNHQPVLFLVFFVSLWYVEEWLWKTHFQEFHGWGMLRLLFFQGLLPWRKRFLPVLQGNLDEWHQTSSWSSWWPILFGRNQFRSLLQYSKVVRFSNNDTGLCEVVDKNSFQTMSRWWFQTFIIFTPIWGRFPFWLIFFTWVETTN